MLVEVMIEKVFFMVEFLMIVDLVVKVVFIVFVIVSIWLWVVVVEKLFVIGGV